MAEFTLAADQSRFPVGSTVGVYGREAFPGGVEAPIGAAVTTGVVAADGTTTFTGLAANTSYFAAAQVSGEWSRVEFRTAPLGLFSSIPPSLTFDHMQAPVWDHVGQQWVARDQFPFFDVTAPPYNAPVNALSVAERAYCRDAIRAVIEDAPGGNGGLGSTIYFPPGKFYTNDLEAKDNHRLQGAGQVATWVYTMPGDNTPIVDQAGDPLYHWNLNNIGFVGSSGHSGPIMRISPYLGDFQNVLFSDSAAAGLELSGGGDRMTILNLLIYRCKIGAHLIDAIHTKVLGGGIENCEIGMQWESLEASVFGIGGGYVNLPFENNTRYSLYLKGYSGLKTENCYFFDAPVGLDQESNNNHIDGTFLNSTVYDGGRGNVVTSHPRQLVDGMPTDRLFPSSIVNDPYEVDRVNWWTPVGGASITKQDPDNGDRMRDRAGWLPPRITGVAGKGGYKTVQNLAVGETYLLEVFWNSGISSGTTARMQVQIIDPAGPTVLFDSGPQSRPNAGVSTESRDSCYRTVFQVPSGAGTTLRIQVTSPDVGTLIPSRTNFIRCANLNGGFEGTYTAGVAPDWTLQSGSTGTASEETSVVKTGTKAQRLQVDAGEKITVGQLIVPDEHSLYLGRCAIRVMDGGIGRAKIGWGNADLNSIADYQVAASARLDADDETWETVTFICRPSSFTRLLFGLTQHATEPADAVFDGFTFFPLKGSDADGIHTTHEFTLSAAGTSTAFVPTHDSILKRITVVYTQAASADAGTQIRVGTAASSTYYGNVASTVSATLGQQVDIPVQNTDLRAGTPVIIQNAGGKTGAGKFVVILMYGS